MIGISILILIFFLVMGVLFAMGKGLSLMSSYRDAPQSEKDRYDEKKLSQGFSMMMFILALCLAVAITGDYLQLKVLSYGGFIALMILSVVLVIIVARRAEKK